MNNSNTLDLSKTSSYVTETETRAVWKNIKSASMLNLWTFFFKPQNTGSVSLFL